MFASVRAISQAANAVDGVEVSVFGLKDTLSSLDVGDWAPLNVLTFAVAGARRFGYAPKLLAALKQSDSDLLHIHGIWMYPSVANTRWSKWSGRPYIVSPHGMLDDWAVRNAHWKKHLALLLYEGEHLRGASCLRALCDAEADAMRRYGLSNPIAVIPNGVSLPAIVNYAGNPSWSAQLPEGSKIAFFLGRIHPKKGLAPLIEAWARAKEAGRLKAVQWHLVIGGWDEIGHQELLCELANSNRVLDTVHFVGPLYGPDKDASFRYADAFILPSYSEGLPMAVLEAWSYSLPVVMTPQCNLPCGVRANAAVECKPQVDSIADALDQLFAMTDAQRELLGRNGRALVERDFDWAQIGQEMVAVYRWMLGHGPRPTCVRENG